MKSLLTIALLIIPFFGFSQNFTKSEVNRFDKVLKRSNSLIREFDKNALVSVERIGNPEIEGMVETALFRSGFNVVSNKVAKEALNISNPLNESNENIEISRSTTYSAIYVFSVSGQYYEGELIAKCQRALITFSARIVDLKNEGKLVGTFSFSGNALTYVACEEDVANALSYSILNSRDQ
jgi:hypothetical protein